jgi:hypothetical protein
MRTGFLFTLVPVIMWSGEQPSLANSILTRTVVSVWLLGGFLMLAALMRGLWRAEFPAAP